MRNLIFLLFASISAVAQVNPTSFNKIKVVNQTKNNNATRVVVQDSITKEFHWVLKSTLGGGSGAVPTFQQVLNAGNIANISQVSGVKAFEVTSPSTVMSFFGETILTSNSTKQGEYGVNGFVHKLNDSSKRARLSYDGLELKTSITNSTGTIKSDNLLANRNFQLPDESGTIATREWVSNNTSSTFQQVLTAGNTYTSSSSYGDVFNISNTYNDGTLDFTKYKIKVTPLSMVFYTTDNSNTTRVDFGGFENNINNNLIAKISAYDGFKLKTNASGAVATVKSDNVTTDVDLQFPNASGTFALKEQAGQVPIVINTAALPLSANVPVGSIYFVSSTSQTYINTGSLWLGL